MRTVSKQRRHREAGFTHCALSATFLCESAQVWMQSGLLPPLVPPNPMAPQSWFLVPNKLALVFCPLSLTPWSPGPLTSLAPGLLSPGSSGPQGLPAQAHWPQPPSHLAPAPVQENHFMCGSCKRTSFPKTKASEVSGIDLLDPILDTRRIIGAKSSAMTQPT